MVFLAEAPKTKVHPTVSKAGFEPRGLCSSLRLIVYLVLHEPQSSVSGGERASADKCLLKTGKPAGKESWNQGSWGIVEVGKR